MTTYRLTGQPTWMSTRLRREVGNRTSRLGLSTSQHPCASRSIYAADAILATQFLLDAFW